MRYTFCEHAYKNENGMFVCGVQTQKKEREVYCHCIYFCKKCGGKWLITDEAQNCRFKEDYHNG